MSDLRSLGFVVNPHAGRRKAHQWKQEIREALAGTGIRHQIIETEQLKDVESEVKKLAGVNDAVFAVGGDGTAHHVAQALTLGKTSFGLLPNGSGNDYSRQIGMPKGVKTGLRKIVEGHKIIEKDVLQLVVTEGNSGQIIKRWSINTTGYGFDAAVSHIKTKVPVLKGIALYLSSALATLLTYKPTDLSGGSAGDEQFQGLMLAAGLGEFEGGGFKIFPGVTGTSGSFQVCEVRENSMVRALPLLLRAVSGKHVTSRRVAMRDTREASWASRQPIPVHADGEVLSLEATHVHIRLVEKALRVIVPA